MATSSYKVIQWGTGNTGQRALREVIRDPLLELVGVRVYNDEKNGVDAGKLCNEADTGVLASTNREEVLKLKADCCVYMPRATGRGETRTGLTEDELVDDLEALTANGINVVSTCTDLFYRGVRLSDSNRRRLLDACNKGNASIWTSGSDPGFVTETLPLALLSIQRNIELIEIEEFGDLSQRPSAHMVMEQMRFGKPMDPAITERRKNHLFFEYKYTLMALAEAAGLDIDEWVADGGMAAASEDTQIVAGLIKKGTAAAHKVVFTGRVGGVDRIRFIQYGFVTRNTDPDWDLQPTGWRLRIDGDAPIHMSAPFPVPLEDLANYVPAFNANGQVNAIPYVCKAEPGILTTLDLPHILPRGSRTKIR